MKLSAASGRQIKVDYGTVDGTAVAGTGDYVAKAGTIVFSPGQVSKAVTVLVNGDIANEPNQSFTVQLSNPLNVGIADATGIGTIVNDD